MSEPGSVPPPPPPASPFNPNAIPAPQQPRARSGCGKPVVIGCVSALLLAAIAALAAFYFIGKDPNRVFRWSLDTMEKGLMGQMSPEVTAAERQRLSAAFDSVGEGLETKRVEPAELQNLNFKILEISRKGPLSSEAVRQLTEDLEALAAGEPGGGEPNPPE